jgi:hypothetical protein
MVWTVDGQDTWVAGRVLRCVRAARKAGTYGSKRKAGDTFAAEFDDEPGTTREIRPLTDLYSTAFAAPAGSWFLFATPSQLTEIVAASS